VAAGIAVGLSLLILAFGWRTIVLPLRRLAGAAEEVSWGSRGVLEQPVAGVTEVRDLHAALARMVERLEGYQAGVLDYLDAVTKGQEEERARLARELHDGPIQSLVALGQRTDMLRLAGDLEDDGETARQLNTLRDAETAVVDDLRRIISDIRPAYLEDLGFVPALEALVQSAATRTEAKVRLKVETEAQRLNGDLELAAYRITQQALGNAVQHAGAAQIVVTVRFDPQRLTLRVADDGRGFEPASRFDAYTRHGHFGLVGIQERVRQLGGTFTIASAPHVGTVVDVRLPT
jgi:two-component system sensor histidine kinase DegS